MRKLQFDHPLGECVVSLPIGWVRYIEGEYRRDLDVAGIHAKYDGLMIHPALSCSIRFTDKGPEYQLMGRAEYQRLNKRRSGIIFDDKGNKVTVDLRKVYRSGKKTRVVSLPEEWHRTQEKHSGEFHCVDILITESLWIRPHLQDQSNWFYKSPHRRYSSPAQPAKQPQ